MVDHQIVSGFVRGNAMYYNIQNVVVRLQGESNHAVLMNSHYDSVPGSPGGSDDVVSENKFRTFIFLTVFSQIAR